MNRSQIGYADNMETATLENEAFRRVLFTGANMQLVAMALKPGEDIGMEVHDEHDQFIRIEEGQAVAVIDSEEIELEDDDAIIIPAGSQHNVTNSGEEVLKLYTIYAPPEHPDGTLQETKEGS